MEKKEFQERIRQKKFFQNNGVVLKGINLLRTQYVSLSELKYALEPTMTEAELRDSVNYLSDTNFKSRYRYNPISTGDTFDSVRR